MHREIDQLYNALLLSMGQEYEHYQELLKAVEEETIILKNCNLADILDFNARKERVLLSLTMAQEMRTDAINKLLGVLKLDKPISVTQLSAYAQHHIRQNLMDYQEKFAGLIPQIEKANERNKDLIRFSLTHIINNINYINSLTSCTPIYNHYGQIKANNLHGRLISREG